MLVAAPRQTQTNPAWYQRWALGRECKVMARQREKRHHGLGYLPTRALKSPPPRISRETCFFSLHAHTLSRVEIFLFCTRDPIEIAEAPFRGKVFEARYREIRAACAYISSSQTSPPPHPLPPTLAPVLTCALTHRLVSGPLNLAAMLSATHSTSKK